jgi:hypothetical protein
MLSIVQATRGAPKRVIAGALVGGLGYAYLAGHFATFTQAAAVAAFIPGLAAVVAAAVIPAARSSRPERSGRGWLAWWVIVAVFTAVELAALLLGANHTHPTVSDLVNPWIDGTVRRAVGYALWLGLGVWMLRR